MSRRELRLLAQLAAAEKRERGLREALERIAIAVQQLCRSTMPQVRAEFEEKP